MSISVVIPAYNEEKYIGKTLESLLQPECKGELEIIIVNDSYDDTEEVVTKFQKTHDNIVLINQKERKGLSAARNRGAQEASYPIIAFLDADCVANRNWLDTIQRRIKAGAICVVGPNFADSPKSFFEKFFFNVSAIGGQIFNITGLPLLTLGNNSAFSKSVFDKIGGYRDILSEDFDMLLRTKKIVKVIYDKDMAVLTSTRRIAEQGYLKTTGALLISYLRLIVKRPIKGSTSSYFRKSSR